MDSTRVIPPLNSAPILDALAVRSLVDMQRLGVAALAAARYAFAAVARSECAVVCRCATVLAGNFSPHFSPHLFEDPFTLHVDGFSISTPRDFLGKSVFGHVG